MRRGYYVKDIGSGSCGPFCGGLPGVFLDRRGASYTWQAAAGDWSVATNWSGSALPTGSDTAYIIGNDAAAITLPGATCSTLSLGGSGGSGNVQMSGGSLSVGFSELVGDAGPGTFTQTGGTNSAGFFDVGNSLGSYGAYTLSGSGLLSSGFETVGVSGSGTFTQTGGTNPSTFVTIGDNAGSNGVYNLSGTGQFSGGWCISALPGRALSRKPVAATRSPVRCTWATIRAEAAHPSWCGTTNSHRRHLSGHFRHRGFHPGAAAPAPSRARCTLAPVRPDSALIASAAANSPPGAKTSARPARQPSLSQPAPTAFPRFPSAAAVRICWEAVLCRSRAI